WRDPRKGHVPGPRRAEPDIPYHLPGAGDDLPQVPAEESHGPVRQRGGPGCGASGLPGTIDGAHPNPSRAAGATPPLPLGTGGGPGAGGAAPAGRAPLAALAPAFGRWRG